MEIVIEFVDDTVLLECPWQYEGDKTADACRMIEEPDRHIGALAEGWIADCSVHARAEVGITEEIVLDHAFDLPRIDVDAETICCGQQIEEGSVPHGRFEPAVEVNLLLVYFRLGDVVEPLRQWPFGEKLIVGAGFVKAHSLLIQRLGDLVSPRG